MADEETGVAGGEVTLSQGALSGRDQNSIRRSCSSVRHKADWATAQLGDSHPISASSPKQCVPLDYLFCPRDAGRLEDWTQGGS